MISAAGILQRFAPEFKGVFKTSHLAAGLTFVWLAFAFKFFGAYFVNLAGSGFYFKPTVAALAMAIAAGFYEETIFAGILYIAAYLRTGNILIPIFMHGIYDYMCFATDPTLENGIMTNEIATSTPMLAIVVDVIAGIWGLYLLRPAKRAEIHAIWDDKWSVIR